MKPHSSLVRTVAQKCFSMPISRLHLFRIQAYRLGCNLRSPPLRSPSCGGMHVCFSKSRKIFCSSSRAAAGNSQGISPAKSDCIYRVSVMNLLNPPSLPSPGVGASVSDWSEKRQAHRLATALLLLAQYACNWPSRYSIEVRCVAHSKKKLIRIVSHHPLKLSPCHNGKLNANFWIVLMVRTQFDVVGSDFPQKQSEASLSP